jgi:hypothetical protein
MANENTTESLSYLGYSARKRGLDWNTTIATERRALGRTLTHAEMLALASGYRSAR